MARNAKTPAVALKLNLTVPEMRRGIERLQERITDLDRFEIAKVTSVDSPPELNAIATSIERTLAKCFGDNTADYNRFIEAADVTAKFSVFSDNYPQVHHAAQQTRSKIENAKHILQEAIKALGEEIYDAEANETSGSTSTTEATILSRKVFVVHGHDEGARESIARFLAQLGFDPIILHEQANRGRTVIEKVEAHDEVGFAVVLLTPDDEGCKKGEKLKPRARQNVILELGYFVGRLGRNKVCALKRGDIEIPSDFGGVVYESYDETGGWRHALGRELQAAGFEIDWNKVMRP